MWSCLKLCFSGSHLPEGVCLRAVVVYIRREDAKEVVRRCADHSAVDQGPTGLMLTFVRATLIAVVGSRRGNSPHV